MAGLPRKANEAYSNAADSGLHTTGGIRSRSVNDDDLSPPSPPPALPDGMKQNGPLRALNNHRHHGPCQDTLPPSHNLRSVLSQSGAGGGGGRQTIVEHPAKIRYDELIKAFDTEMQKLQSLVLQKESETTRLSEELETVTRKKSQLETELKEVKKQLEDESESNRELKRRVSQMEIDKESYKKKLASAEQNKERAEEVNKELRAQHKDEKHKLELQISKMETEQSRLCIEMEKTKREHAEFKAELATKEMELNRLKSEAKEKEMQKEIEELKKQVATRDRSRTD